MNLLSEEAKRQTEKRRQRHQRENRLTRKITRVIVLGTVICLLIVSVIGYQIVKHNLSPYNAQDNNPVAVEIQPGATLRSVAKQLEDMKIIRSATALNFYFKTKFTGTLRAGHYEMSPAMSLDEIITVLSAEAPESKKVLATVLLKEGEHINDLAKTIEKSTPFKASAFLELVNDETFVNKMVEKYPKLLTDMTKQNGLKYKLEGYLFPATYDYREDDTLETLVESMIAKTNQVLTKYYDQITASKLNVHQVLTIASLTEKEGVKTDDRKKIVSVFNNRIAQNMPLQSDISILYALGEHKELVTFADLEVDSPYNLYKHVGFGPGPFNSPSEDAIAATLNPIDTEFVYFVADLDTGIVYFAKTYDEHLKLVDQYVNK